MLRSSIRIGSLLKTFAFAAAVGLLLYLFGGSGEATDIPALSLSLLYHYVQPEFAQMFSILWAFFPFFIGLFLLHNVFGADLAVVSIYLFTRAAGRFSWYAGKTAALFVHVLLYAMGLFTGMLAGGALAGNVVWTLSPAFPAFFAQYTLFFFTALLTVNLFGCKFPPHLVMLASLGGIFLLTALACLPGTGWWFHCNPITYYFTIWNTLYEGIRFPLLILAAAVLAVFFIGYAGIRRLDVAIG